MASQVPVSGAHSVQERPGQSQDQGQWQAFGQSLPHQLRHQTRLPALLLIFAVVADLFNMSIICNPDFTGHITDEDTASKISAFADDTAVHVGYPRDIVIYKETLIDYSVATGCITNLAKSEAVILGSWRQLKPDVGVWSSP